MNFTRQLQRGIAEKESEIKLSHSSSRRDLPRHLIYKYIKLNLKKKT